MFPSIAGKRHGAKWKRSLWDKLTLQISGLKAENSCKCWLFGDVFRCENLSHLLMVQKLKSITCRPLSPPTMGLDGAGFDAQWHQHGFLETGLWFQTLRGFFLLHGVRRSETQLHASVTLLLTGRVLGLHVHPFLSSRQQTGRWFTDNTILMYWFHYSCCKALV